MISISRIANVFMLCAIMMVVCNFPSWADIVETQKLRFGRWAITNNTSQNTIMVATDGSYTASPALIMLSPPQQGIYSVTDLPAFTVINSVTVTMTQPLHAGGGPNFTIDNFTTSIPAADGTGQTTLTMGATARTSGSGQPYPDNVYVGELHIELNY